MPRCIHDPGKKETLKRGDGGEPAVKLLTLRGRKPRTRSIQRERRVADVYPRKSCQYWAADLVGEEKGKPTVEVYRGRKTDWRLITCIRVMTSLPCV